MYLEEHYLWDALHSSAVSDTQVLKTVYTVRFAGLSGLSEFYSSNLLQFAVAYWKQEARFEEP